ncbi:tautomerase family protein [Novosphingobium sp. 9U]|uniref:tautomerase family protein n=1 Tax=Novosphingobium sp. 9U TaxID=2653158 RepID=UPI0012F29602|nr:tautomerase family protein [Novosphingobium sp. 9U]VWX54617.1 4-oxalocrotonate tautomerase [Novosphingobium sp. 9U]
MPHVIVKLWPGKSEAQKRDLSAAIVEQVTRILDYGEDAVSVGFDEVAPSEWSARVYEPAVQGKWGTLYKRPGYGPAATTAS